MSPDIQPNESSSPSRFGSGNPDEALLSLLIRRARSPEDIQEVYRLRSCGYKKYSLKEDHLRDDLDSGSGAVLLLATRSDGCPAGTLRILDRRFSQIELDSFVPVDELLPPDRQPVAEATRFCVPFASDAKWIKLALWKAFFCYCVESKIKTMLISVRSGASRDYRSLLFESLGKRGMYVHSLLGSHAHETYAFDVSNGPELYRSTQHPLHGFFVLQDHPNITFA